MPFNNSMTGYQNEYDFVNLVNNKKMCDIDFSLQLFIIDIFGDISNNSIIHGYVDRGKRKYDIVIMIDNDIRRISIKKGSRNSVHVEPISEFIHFLIENEMPKHMIENFLRYHYADGTTNGTGNNRVSIEKYKELHQNEIDEINSFINKKEFLINAIDRFVIQGRNSNAKIDAILYGVPDDFLWIKRVDICNILLEKRNDYSTGIHFSHLSYQPLNRCLNANKKYEKDRFISQLKWFKLCDDIIENMGIL